MTHYPAGDQSLQLAFAPAALPLLRSRYADAALRRDVWATVTGLECVIVATGGLLGLLSNDFRGLQYLLLLGLAGMPLALAPVALYFTARNAARELAREISDLEGLKQRYNRA